MDGILLAIVLLIARGLPLRETFGLRAPRSWGAAALIGAATLIVAYALSYAEVGLLQDAHREQSVPEFFDATRLGAWVANLFAIAIFVPIFEESLCRGLGFSLLEPLGKPAAVVLTAVGFTLAHGVVVDFPVILATGLGFPMPEELPIVFGGVLTAHEEVRWYFMLPVCIVGVIVGDSFLYLIGRFWGAKLVQLQSGIEGLKLRRLTPGQKNRGI